MDRRNPDVEHAQTQDPGGHSPAAASPSTGPASTAAGLDSMRKAHEAPPDGLSKDELAGAVKTKTKVAPAAEVAHLNANPSQVQRILDSGEIRRDTLKVALNKGLASGDFSHLTEGQSKAAMDMIRALPDQGAPEKGHEAPAPGGPAPENEPSQGERSPAVQQVVSYLNENPVAVQAAIDSGQIRVESFKNALVEANAKNDFSALSDKQVLATADLIATVVPKEQLTAPLPELPPKPEKPAPLDFATKVKNELEEGKAFDRAAKGIEVPASVKDALRANESVAKSLVIGFHPDKEKGFAEQPVAPREAVRFAVAYAEKNPEAAPAEISKAYMTAIAQKDNGAMQRTAEQMGLELRYINKEGEVFTPGQREQHQGEGYKGPKADTDPIGKVALDRVQQAINADPEMANFPEEIRSKIQEGGPESLLTGDARELQKLGVITYENNGVQKDGAGWQREPAHPKSVARVVEFVKTTKIDDETYRSLNKPTQAVIAAIRKDGDYQITKGIVGDLTRKVPDFRREEQPAGAGV